jgi:anaerobic ribonucleoside-triphosphate reductase
MQAENAIELKGEERTRCEIWVSQDRSSSGQNELGERLAGMPDRTEPTGTCAGIILDDSERTRCEIWTRVMGYHRPVSAWNAGKKAEHKERKYFRESCPRS